MNRTNKEIVDFLNVVSTTDKFYATESDKNFLRKYDECDDYVLSKGLIKETWEVLQSKLNTLQGITKIVDPLSILHTNAGTGKVLSDCPSDNVDFTALNNDFICKSISDLMNQHFSIDFYYRSEISDISHFFINGDKSNTPKYDIVFNQHIETDYYKGIDGTSLQYLNSLEYYSLRSLDFLTKGGYLCVFMHPRKFAVLNENREFKSKTTLVSKISKDDYREFGCLIFKKN